MTFTPAHTRRHSTSGGLRRIELLDALRGFALLGASMLALHRIPLFDAKSALLLVVLFGVGRVGVLRESVAYRRFWRGLLAVSFVVTVLLVLRHGGASTLADRLLLQVASLAQGLFCIAAFVLLFQRTAWRRQLRKLAPMGRMAFTHCLALALIGLVLVPRLGLDVGSFTGAAMLGAGVFALQAMASCWWMARFRQGPLEGAWHRLILARQRPMQWLRAVRGS